MDERTLKELQHIFGEDRVHIIDEDSFPEKKWEGTWPTTCCICGDFLPDNKYFCDASDNQGHWGLFCPDCHKTYCSGRLGTGRGQKYDSKTLIKLEG